MLSTLLPIPNNYLESLSLNVASEFTSAVREEDTFKMYDIYNPSCYHGGTVRVIDKGQWAPDKGLNHESSEYKYIRRADLRQLRLNFSVAVRSYYNKKEKYLII